MSNIYFNLFDNISMQLYSVSFFIDSSILKANKQVSTINYWIIVNTNLHVS